MENKKLISREEARKLNLARYFDNEPCLHGHIVEKFVANGRCVECSRISKNKWYNKNKPEINAAIRHRYREDEVYRKRCKKYEEDYIGRIGIEKYREMNAAYARKRRSTNVEAKLAVSIRNYLMKALKAIDGKKEKHTREYIKYSPLDLKQHLQNNFLGDMTFENMGEVWNIDHHIPVSKFISSGEDRVDKINALDNLFPMYCEDNSSKSNRDWRDWAELYPERAELYRKQNRPVY